jgi:nitrite reductase/ring-hydroxylating ferredoxin subunit/uncharacterized membrane protein
MTLSRRLATKLQPLDKLADILQPKLQKALDSSLPLRNLLDGTWLGAPLHPALTDVPVGASTTAFLLDLGATVGRSDKLSLAADRAPAVAVLGTVPAAVTGAADWRDLRGETRRIGTLHALLNTAGVMLNISSLALRAGGNRTAGRLTSTTALLASSLAAHIGGELSFGQGVRVNRTAWETAPDDFTAVADAADVDQSLHRVALEDAPVLLTRAANGRLCAIAATCSHFGGPLDEGRREGDTVICPWHASRFDLCTGEVIDGPAVFAQPRYEAREHEGKIELRRNSDG